MSDYGMLRKLGLSRMGIACYKSLFEDGAGPAAQLAERLSQSRTGLYRVLRQMERQGFVTSLKTHRQPAYFDAELLDKALTRHAEYQRHIVSDLIEKQAEIMTRRSGKTKEQTG